MAAPSSPQDFVKKWKQIELKERSAAQAHFRDLCVVLGQPTPEDADPTGQWYCFEKGATKTTGGEGWADVWMRQHFGWEYKGKGKDLTAAYAQLQRYAPALENPPLLIVSDMDRIVLHTNWTNTVPVVREIPLDRLAEPEYLQVLRWAFTDPDRLKPGVTTEDVTRKAAGTFAGLAQRLRDSGYEAQRVAHFLNRLVFCLFAEDAGLLPANVFTRALAVTRKRPETAQAMLRDLFGVMHTGGTFGPEFVDWFNGGLFDSADALPMTREDIDVVLDAARLDWSSIEPSIFGTLFERGLDPSKRSQLGAHYTDAGSILRIVNPVIKEPILDEWAQSKTRIETLLAKAETAKAPATRSKARKDAEQTLQGFLHRLGEYRVLDPACGSGNFLYLALQTLKDIEHRVSLEAEQLGLHPEFVGMNTGVHNVHGIELNSYAAELARLTVWIGEIQWMLKHGVQPAKNPILKSADTIECRDAVLNADGGEPEWPKCDAIVGNPPFLGGKKLAPELGEERVAKLRAVYEGDVGAGADLVCYWFAKALRQLERSADTRVGLVATQSIRHGVNRIVLNRIAASARIFNAWSDEPWVNEGASVRVSMVCFGKGELSARLNDQPAAHIGANLADSGGSGDLTMAEPLRENGRVAFQGLIPRGDFVVDGATARRWLLEPNPHGGPNTDVLRQYANASEIVKRPSDSWVVTFGENPLAWAALYEGPFRWVEERVKPARAVTNQASSRELWWIHWCPRPELQLATKPLKRYVATPRVAKHRIFRFLPVSVLPDSRLYAIAREDDATFGVLTSRVHETWSLANASMHGVGNDPTYNARSCFETFAFPNGLTPNLKPGDYTNRQAERIAEIAARLNELRENWLNPPEWTERVPEVVAGYPDRIVAKPGCEDKLKKRTLTNLYNERPTWLANVHRELDAAVAEAYGWGDYTDAMGDEEILRRLLVLNLERAGH